MPKINPNSHIQVRALYLLQDAARLLCVRPVSGIEADAWLKRWREIENAITRAADAIYRSLR